MLRRIYSQTRMLFAKITLNFHKLSRVFKLIYNWVCSLITLLKFAIAKIILLHCTCDIHASYFYVTFFFNWYLYYIFKKKTAMNEQLFQSLTESLSAGIKKLCLRCLFFLRRGFQIPFGNRLFSSLLYNNFSMLVTALKKVH